METADVDMTKVWFAVIILFFLLLAGLSYNANETLGAGILTVLAFVFFVSYRRFY